MFELYEAFDSVIPIFIILFLAVIFITVFINQRSGYKLDNAKKRINYLSYVGLIMTLVGIFLVTMLPSSNPEKVTQFVPFYSIVDTWEYATTRAIVNSLFMNVILFIPLGFFLYMIIRKEFLTTLLACLLSIFIEFLQYILPIGRISNIDDVILNTMGGVIGMVAAFIFVKLGIVYYLFETGKRDNKH